MCMHLARPTNSVIMPAHPQRSALRCGCECALPAPLLQVILDKNPRLQTVVNKVREP